ncbi:MAG: hypothetical protein ACRDLC_15435 [Actinomycetota bacterium]
MAEPRRLERLSGQDLLMLWADFGWSEDIGVRDALDDLARPALVPS